jgi:hypothetical protein
MGFIAERRVPSGMMSEREDRRLLYVSIAFITGLVAIGIIVANIRYLDLGEGSQGAGPEIREITMALMYALAIIWVVVFLVYILRRKATKQVQESKEQGKSNSIIALIIIGVLILASLAVNQTQPINQGQTDPGSGTTPNDPAHNPIINDETGGTGVFFILIGVLGAALAFVAMKHNRSTPLRFRKAQFALAQQNATETIRQASMDLFAGEDPRSVIVRTYQQMSRLLGQGGKNLKSLTPREVAELAELNFNWPRAPLTELTLLFEEAWYSQHAMGEAERDRALKAFEAITSRDKGRRPDLGRAAA